MTTAQPEFDIRRIYAKDLSFEAPNMPQLFREEWQPQVSVELNINHSKLEDTLYEVVLRITATAKIAEKTAFVVEVKQAGIFHINNFPENQLPHMLAVYCPTVIFPYVREAISDLVVRASLPPLTLAPINFDSLFRQQQQQAAAENSESNISNSSIVTDSGSTTTH